MSLHPEDPSSKMALQGLLASLFDSTTYAPASLRAYQSDWKDFATWMRFDVASDAIQHVIERGPAWTHQVVTEYRNQCLNAGYAVATINRRISSVRAVIGLARDRGLVSWCLGVDGIPIHRCPQVGTPADRVRCLLAAGARLPNHIKSARDVALVWLLFAPALRIGEVSALRCEDLDGAGRVLVIRSSGRIGSASVILPSLASTAIQRWLGVRGNTPGPLFMRLDHPSQGRPLSTRGISKAIVALGKSCGVHVNPNALRNGGIACALDEELGVCSVRHFARIADVSSRCRCNAPRHDGDGLAVEAVAKSVLHFRDDS